MSSAAEAQRLFVDEEFEEALEHATLAIEEEPSNVENRLLRAQIHIKLNNFAEAIADANQAIAMDSKSSKAYFRKGVAAFNLEEFRTAKAAFEKARELDPNNQSIKTYIRKCDAELESEESEPTSAPSQPQPQPQQQQPSPSPAAASTSTTTTTSSSSSSSSTAALVNAAAALSVQKQQQSRFRHAWFQNPACVTLEVFIKGSNAENCKVEFSDQSVELVRQLEANDSWQMDLELFDTIVPHESTVSFLSTKVEIKMKKAKQTKWDALEKKEEEKKNLAGDDEDDTKKIVPQRDLYPSSKGAKNWSKISSEVDDDKPEGDEALNKFFQELYEKSSEETRRAMNKSFMESGGTVLSTNWSEVGVKKVDGTPPDGLEMKKWSDLGK